MTRTEFIKKIENEMALYGVEKFTTGINVSEILGSFASENDCKSTENELRAINLELPEYTSIEPQPETGCVYFEDFENEIHEAEFLRAVGAATSEYLLDFAAQS